MSEIFFFVLYTFPHQIKYYNVIKEADFELNFSLRTLQSKCGNVMFFLLSSSLCS